VSIISQAPARKDDISRLLSGGKAPPAAQTGGVGEDLGLSSWATVSSPGLSAVNHLLPAIREKTQGRSLLYVGNRPDEPLRKRLVELLGPASLDWCDISSAASAYVDRVASGSYALVLAATGFMDHAVELRFRTALPEGGRLVRIRKGRPMATLLALARDFGLGG